MKTQWAFSLPLAALIGLFTSINSTAAEDKAATPGQSTADATKVSTDGFSAMRAMHTARVAIFNGDTKLCVEMLTKADEDLVKTSKDEKIAKVKTDLIPIDGSMALADTFVQSEKKAAHIGKANEHFKAGRSKEGIEELKLGEVDVSFSRILMPLEATKKRLNSAIALAKEHKYYECNLALKAAEDGLETDSITLFEFPKAGGKGDNKPSKPGK